MVVSELLADELDSGKGPLLRLMELEMRLRATLTHTLRQLKDLRALHRVRAEEDAEAEADGEVGETATPVEWDDDEDRWCDAAAGRRRRARRERRDAKRQAEAAAVEDPTVEDPTVEEVCTGVPDLQNEPTAAPAPAHQTEGAQPSGTPQVTPPADAACLFAGDRSASEGEPTEPKNDVAPPMTPISTDENGHNDPPSPV
jgi:hypothetical protein